MRQGRARACTAALKRDGHARCSSAGHACWRTLLRRACDRTSPRGASAGTTCPTTATCVDGGHYRQRRHSCFVVTAQAIDAVPHRAALAKRGVQRAARRHRALVRADGRRIGCDDAAWRALLARPGRHARAACAARSRGTSKRIRFASPPPAASAGPRPKGAHRDGVDFVAVILVAREGIKGGETRVFDAHGPHRLRFTLDEPFSALLLDDARVIHESTPIQPLEPATRRPPRHAGADVSRQGLPGPAA